MTNVNWSHGTAAGRPENRHRKEPVTSITFHDLATAE